MTLVTSTACRRIDCCRRLAAAAGTNDGIEEIETVLHELEEAGLQPGPRAYHVLVFAHTKREEPEAAWHAATRAIAAGAVLLEETYILLILGHMKVGRSFLSIDLSIQHRTRK